MAAKPPAIEKEIINPMRFSTIALLCSGAAILSAADAPAPAQIYNRNLASVEGEAVLLAEAMPADRYNFAPAADSSKGARAFRQHERHIAAANYMIGALLKRKPPVALRAGENGPESIAGNQSGMIQEPLGNIPSSPCLNRKRPIPRRLVAHALACPISPLNPGLQSRPLTCTAVARCRCHSIQPGSPV
jgi:hypothetical protein